MTGPGRKYLWQDTDRHGKRRRYFRRRGFKKVRLRTDPAADPEGFAREFNAAAMGTLQLVTPRSSQLVRKHGFVYVVGFGTSVKIGYSAKVKKRIASIQTSCPVPLTIYAIKNANRSDEVALHKKFARYRLNGEWFELAEPIAKFIADTSPL